MKPVSLYLHIPFCARRCNYCNFFSTTRLGERGKYIEAMKRAIAAASLDNREAVTIYFGGGTPSLLGTGLLDILAAIRERLPIAADAEITLEANPATIDLDTMGQLRRGGFNRISLGLEADDDEALRRLGRLHTAEQGRKSVEMARQAGFENISVDIMLATPEQDIASAIALCEGAVALDVPHISAYLLRVEADTPFGRQHAERLCADSDGAADIYMAACGVFAASGYSHYEVSNFARAGYESRHNNAYWNLTEYLGIGPAAYSFMEGERFHLPEDLDSFMESESIWESTVSDGTGGDLTEYIMLSLRLSAGLSLEVLRGRYGFETAALLTDSGFLVSNSVINYLSAGI
ncbi:MAG: radical SAM family heme chaperone HemW [Angelakisella sp.]